MACCGPKTPHDYWRPKMYLSKTTRKALIKIDQIIPIALALLVAFGMLFLGSGCDDGGYEFVPGPGDGGSGEGGSTTLNPPGSGGSNPGGGYGGGNPSQPGCHPVPLWWDLRTYQGCTAEPARMAGLFRGSDHHEKSFTGKVFTDTEGDHNGEEGSLFYLVKPDSGDCGLIKVAMVSSSGTVEIKVAAEVDFYMLVPELVEEVWMKLHNGNPPTNEQYYSAEFSSLLLDLFECEKENTSCSLKSKLSNGLPLGIVLDNGSGTGAVTNGAFCDRMFIVMKSRLP
jgi:hypothetical protein